LVRTSSVAVWLSKEQCALNKLRFGNCTMQLIGLKDNPSVCNQFVRASLLERIFARGMGSVPEHLLAASPEYSVQAPSLGLGKAERRTAVITPKTRSLTYILKD
jgi:hypothetical protein